MSLSDRNEVAMSYKIAVASTDGIYVDAHFGSASSFLIYEVNPDGSYEKRGERIITGRNIGLNCDSIIPIKETENSCGSCGGHNGHSDTKIEANISIIADCRCLLCYKIGAGAERQLERKAITVFQVDYKIEDALKKIIDYYTKIDNHLSLRNAK